MSVFPDLDDQPLWKLMDEFRSPGAAAPADEDDRYLWQEEAAVRIAKRGIDGIDFLIDHVAPSPSADGRNGANGKPISDAALRAALVGLRFMNRRHLRGKRKDRLREVFLSLLGDSRPLIVAEAVDCLSSLGYPESAEAVRKLLSHPSPYVVGSVLRFLSRQSPKSARPILEKYLSSPEPIIRQNALDELDELGAKKSLAKIRRLLNDRDPDVRQAAETAVANLKELAAHR